jgi:hypothetical protein
MAHRSRAARNVGAGGPADMHATENAGVAAAIGSEARREASRSGRRNDGVMGMTRYLILPGADVMDHIPGENGPAVARAAHAVRQKAMYAGVFVRNCDNKEQR